jgi:hypothetical protein
MRAARSLSRIRASLVLAALLTGALLPAAAEDRWSRERSFDSSGAMPEPYAQPPPWRAPPSRPVERGELAPVMASDASGLPLELWQGLDLAALEALLLSLELPPRSPALHSLWRRMLMAAATPPLGVGDAEYFTALRLEALYRSGLLADMGEVLAADHRPDAVVAALAARLDIGLGRRKAGCERVAALASPRSGLPGRLKGELQLLSGYCAAAAGDRAGVGLAVELAREEGFDAALPLAVLAGFAAQTKPRLELPKRVLLLDYRFLELLGPVAEQSLIERAEPALLVALASDDRADAELKVAATEAAVGLHALPAEALAAAYRRLAEGGAQRETGTTAASARRAMMLRALKSARTPAERIRETRALMEDGEPGRRSGLADALARLIAPELAARDDGWEAGAAFAETATAVALSAGEVAGARQWASALPAWRELIAIVAPQDGRPAPPLAAIAELAATGRIRPEALHRLVTVLDGLDCEVPIALWDAASLTPQPATGYLPDTGTLAELAAAVKRREVGRTVLLVVRALGPNGPEGAHVLALRDGVRALQRVGLAADARRLALEALLPVWPRATEGGR